MIEIIRSYPVTAYITLAIVYAIVELRIDGGAKTADSAFWAVAAIVLLFPFALIRRAYIITSRALLWAITPGNRALRRAATREVDLIISKAKKSTEKSS